MTAFGIYFTFSLFCTSERKTEVIVMFTSKPSSKIINFMSPGKGVLTKRWKKKTKTPNKQKQIVLMYLRQNLTPLSIFTKLFLLFQKIISNIFNILKKWWYNKDKTNNHRSYIFFKTKNNKYIFWYKYWC